MLQIFIFNGLPVNEMKIKFSSPWNPNIYKLYLFFATRHAAHYIENFSGTVPNLAIGVTIMKVMVSINTKGSTPVANKKIGKMNLLYTAFLKGGSCS